MVNDAWLWWKGLTLPLHPDISEPYQSNRGSSDTAQFGVMQSRAEQSNCAGVRMASASWRRAKGSETQEEAGGKVKAGQGAGVEESPPGELFAEVSTLDKVFMTLGQFSADIQELHATGPLMKLS